MKFCNYSFILYLFIFLLPILLLRTSATLSTDQAALVSFMSSIFLDPQGALGTWNSTIHVCNWIGVGCNIEKLDVTKLDLRGRLLIGKISPSLGNLKSLLVLDLSQNYFQGQIPPELGFISELAQISLASNFLTGEIPYELGRLNKLNYLNLGGNNLVGNIPKSIFCNGLSSLEYLDLSNNSLSGDIPMKQGCELKNLTYLLLWSNFLSGYVPLSLSKSKKLMWVDLESNNLSGELPSKVMEHMPMLQYVYLSYNEFVGHDDNTNLEPFFASLANASNLQELELAGNNLGGKLPANIGSLSNLIELHLDDNLIYGPIPPQISNLVNLTLLNLSSNLLNGSIPHELSRLKKLERLYLGNNSLSGEIPSSFGDMPHLGLLDLSRNKLTGSIPKGLANLAQLRWLLLYENHLSRPIPPSLGECINLEILDLSHNQLSGIIPSEVAGLSSLTLYLNLSSNLLTGPIPLELSKMDMVLEIDLSTNNLSGTIPSQLESCIALESLNLSNNHLEGSLPNTIAQLPYLQSFDVSTNELIGEIPDSFQASSTLMNLNFSYNKFYGYVPNKGMFSLLNVSSFLGNYGLCGSIKGMQSCEHRKARHHFMIWPLLVSAFGMTLSCLLVRALLLERRITALSYNRSDSNSSKQIICEEPKYPRISHQQLFEATNGFNYSNLIGSGRFGRVYKGTLQDNTKVAVKVLGSSSISQAASEVSGSFKRECQVLKTIRHRNLIKIITTCSKSDFKAIVFPLMSNGSLENHLYPCHNGLRHGLDLDLTRLVCICTNVAEGMAYLHHYSPVKVIHCDLKPSNILLNDDMNALVTDFGIAKLVIGDDNDSFSVHDSASFSSTDGLLCGSVGYIAPEYGLGRRASTQGDVYSFGVLLLEIVTGKRPTDVLFDESSSLQEWVKSHYPHNLEPIVELAQSRFVSFAPYGVGSCNNKTLLREIVLELIELGLMCTQYCASTRPTMLDIAQEMERLKQYILSPIMLMDEVHLDS
ncbi:putative leucine-rich repeat receptor-like serine/threonine-protein kinase At2g24130 [Amaranthus tricolor]|uniref:putative leucine-rich repeat receptor-like serine/threonine-protein kinase At2g24130 n=1 Tax=Amaranthus tricolor TaxID=29722 RepID=UPI00258DAA3E|nr:putative leucine-rich repeat receptor-like serine/threonine-protein kinase At2g24130 [Amaranthus tricolor]